MKALISVACSLALLTSCQSFHSFPGDDHSSTRWLEIDRGECFASSRTVVTDNEYVHEYYVRINEGRNRGRHVLKDQKRVVLPAADAQAFWRYVDKLNLASWTDSDMPQTTDYPSLTYRKNSSEVELHSLERRLSDENILNCRRFEALQERIYALEKLSTTGKGE
jgi:hypothetical protein